jgi:hypothetical protein
MSMVQSGFEAVRGEEVDFRMTASARDDHSVDESDPRGWWFRAGVQEQSVQLRPLAAD